MSRRLEDHLYPKGTLADPNITPSVLDSEGSTVSYTSSKRKTSEQTVVDLGDSANSNTGDPLRTAFTKINNFIEASYWTNETVATDLDRFEARLDSDETEIQRLKTEFNELFDSEYRKNAEWFAYAQQKFDSDSLALQAAKTHLEQKFDSEYANNRDQWNLIYQRLDSDQLAIQQLQATVDGIQDSDAFSFPLGDSAARPTPGETGMARFNTDTNSFEGYNGTAWTSLGGLIDVDQDTYVIAEDSSGADNDELDFYTAGNLRLSISNIGVADFSTTNAIKVPVGTTGERPTAATGMVRFNSSQSTFEGYNGAAWSSLGGVTDVDQDTYIKAEDSAGTDNDELDFFTGGTNRLTLSATGSAFTGNMNVTGTITATGDITAFSDERLKTDIEPIENALDKVLQIEGVRFRRKDDTEYSVGFIAQQIETVVPEVVKEASDYKSVAYGNVTALLVEAVKELSQKVEDLTARLNELEK